LDVNSLTRETWARKEKNQPARCTTSPMASASRLVYGSLSLPESNGLTCCKPRTNCDRRDMESANYRSNLLIQGNLRRVFLSCSGKGRCFFLIQPPNRLASLARNLGGPREHGIFLT
jgi:hypothetical protein